MTTVRPDHAFPRPLALAAVGVLYVAACLYTTFHRGPWYDELYTFYVTRPGVPLAALVPAWMRDNHPPLFYFLTWATGALGDTVEPRRLLNMGILAVAVAALAVVFRRNNELRPAGFFYTLALAGNFPAIDRASELRSYFLSYAIVAVALPVLAIATRPHRNKLAPGSFIALVAVLGIAFSVHLATTVIIAMVTFAFGLRLLILADWRGAVRLILATLLAALPFVVSMAIQLGTIAGNTRTFWIPAGFNAAKWSFENEIIATLSTNLPLTLAAVIGMGLGLYNRRFAGISLVTTLGAGFGLAIAVLMAIHLQRPLVINRYLVALDPIMAMMLAVGAAMLVDRLPRLARTAVDLCAVIATIWSIDANFHSTLARPSWTGTASAIAAIAHECPGTLVHTDTRWNQKMIDQPPIDNRAVLAFAYPWVASLHGFRIEPDGSRAMSTTCPTVFWTEHVSGQNPAATLVANGLRAEGYAIGRARICRIANGWILVADPVAVTPAR